MAQLAVEHALAHAQACFVAMAVLAPQLSGGDCFPNFVWNALQLKTDADILRYKGSTG